MDKVRLKKGGSGDVIWLLLPLPELVELDDETLAPMVSLTPDEALSLAEILAHLVKDII